MTRTTPSAPGTQVAKTSGQNPSGISIWVEKSDFRALLEEALHTARLPPATFWSVILTLVVSLGFGVAQVVDNSPAMLATSFIFGIITSLTVGVAIGRWLRPIPTDKEVERFAASIRERAGFADYTADARALAQKIRETTYGGAPLEHSGRLGLVEVEAIAELIKAVEHGGHVERNVRYRTRPSATREFVESQVVCAECENKVKVEGASDCSKCGAVLCQSCVQCHPPHEPLVCAACPPLATSN